MRWRVCRKVDTTKPSLVKMNEVLPLNELYRQSLVCSITLTPFKIFYMYREKPYTIHKLHILWDILMIFDTIIYHVKMMCPVLIWVQYVWKGYEQTPLVGKNTWAKCMCNICTAKIKQVYRSKVLYKTHSSQLGYYLFWFKVVRDPCKKITQCF